MAATADLDDDGSLYLDDPRTEVAVLVPSGQRVLDVGCSRGAFGAELKRLDPSRAVYGIEPTAAVTFAGSRLDGAVRGFFPQDVPVAWEPFDIVCFNDVLEHIADPWTVLVDTERFLRSKGRVVASIPNVRFIDVVVDLALRGEWRYQPTGVLDRTHLRFFTKRGIVELFEGAGYVVEQLIPTHTDESKRLAARVIRGAGLTARFVDLMAQRYVVVAARS
jgi:2-polyprenyl-3-methyl-5-hydroxy-6-metoxy-1,4-benzoquinol methylase